MDDNGASFSNNISSNADSMAPPPPAYSADDPNPHILSESRPTQSTTTVNIVNKNPNEVLCVHSFTSDLPLFINTNGITKQRLVIETDSDLTNTSNIKVSALVTSSSTGISGKCKAIAGINEWGENELCVTYSSRFWNSDTADCRFYIKVPRHANVNHPGIRARLNNGAIEANYLSNICFDTLDLSTASSRIKLKDVRANQVFLAVTEGEVKCADCVIMGRLHVNNTTSGAISITDTKAGDIYASTTSSKLQLTKVKARNICATTYFDELECGNVVATGKMSLYNTGAPINTLDTTAKCLYINTTDFTIEGTYKVRDVLDIVASNCTIRATLLLQDPNVNTYIRLQNNNADIKAHLVGFSFSGTFDLHAPGGQVSIRPKRCHDPRAFIDYVVEGKACKQGTVSNGVDKNHQLIASTRNGGIKVNFI